MSVKKGRKKLSEKQLAALARGRANLAAKRVVSEQPSEQSAQNLKAKRIGGRRWWPIYLGLGLLILTVLIARLYMGSNNNMILAVLFVMFGVAGILSIFLGFKKRDEGYIFVRPGGEKVKINANCLNIYYALDENGKAVCDYIAFEEMIPVARYESLEKEGLILPGQVKGDILSKMPQRCLDDGKLYYAHIFDPFQSKLMPFKLPDTQYFDPREMINPITMQAVKKELKPIPTLGERLRPALLVAAIAILSVLFIATGAPPAPGG